MATLAELEAKLTEAEAKEQQARNDLAQLHIDIADGKITPEDTMELLRGITNRINSWAYTAQKTRDEIAAFVEPEPEPEPEPEQDELREVHEGVEIWWIPSISRFRAQVATGYLAVATTIEDCRRQIDEIQAFLEPAPEGEWAWPMNSVQQWFDSLWDNVLSAPMQAMGSFWDAYILPKLDSIRDKLAEGITWVYDQIKPTLDSLFTAIDSVWQDLSNGIVNVITNLSTAITNIGDWIWEQISPALDAIGTAIAESQKAVSATITTGLEKTAESISPLLTTLGNGLVNVMNAGTELLLLDYRNTSKAIQFHNDNIFAEWSEKTDNFVLQAISGGMDWVTNALSGVAGALGDGLSNWFDGILKSLGNIAEMIFGAVNFVIAKLKDGVTWLLSDFLNVLTTAMSPGSPPPQIQMAARVLSETAYERQFSMIDAMYQSDPTPEGLSQAAKDMQTLLMTAATAAIGVGLAADLANPLTSLGFRPTMREIVYWTGIPSVTAAIAVMPTSIGLLEPMRYALNERWTPHIPPANDLVRFALREVWDETRREALIAFYPGVQYAGLMAKHGYKTEFAEYYWMAHWVLPSVGQLNEMLYRGIIEVDVWEDFVRYNDYIPEMIPNLQQIIYKPYTRVDSRRMWDLGILTDEQIFDNFLWLGYDEEHARTMTIWTKAYVIAQDIRALYSKGWIDEHGAREMVLQAGIPEARADIFLKRLVRVEQPTRMEGERDLTKTDILRMLKIKILTEPQTIDMLVGLGYDQSEAFYLVQLYTYIGEIDLKELTMSQTLKAYRYEIYNREQAKDELVEHGWAREAAETLLVLEDVKLLDAQTERARERDLTRTDITNSIEAEILDVPTGMLYLAYLGYSDWEISIILALKGIEIVEVTP